MSTSDVQQNRVGPHMHVASCNTAIPIYTVVSGYAVFCPGLQKGTFARGITF